MDFRFALKKNVLTLNMFIFRKIGYKQATQYHGYFNHEYVGPYISTDAGQRTFILYGDAGFAIDPQIVTPFR
jgi:hypothetical protein